MSGEHLATKPALSVFNRRHDGGENRNNVVGAEVGLRAKQFRTVRNRRAMQVGRGFSGYGYDWRFRRSLIDGCDGFCTVWRQEKVMNND